MPTSIQNIVSPALPRSLEHKLEKHSQAAAPYFTTKHYGMFKFYPENRPVRPSHVAQLQESMKERYLPRIIICTIPSGETSLFIVDGQHGFEAAKGLGLPIYYSVVEGLTVEDMVRLNKKNRSWTPADYLHHYCVRGYKPYLALKKYREKVLLDEVAISDCISIVSMNLGNPGSGIMEKFRDGKYEITESQLDRAEEFGSHLLEFEPYTKHWNKSNFIRALMHFFRNTEYNRRVMIEKVKRYGKTILPVAASSIIGYGDTLEDVYNKFARKDSEIFINWKEVESRNPDNGKEDNGGDADE